MFHLYESSPPALLALASGRFQQRTGGAQKCLPCFYLPQVLLISTARVAELDRVQAPALEAMMYLVQHLRKPRVGAGGGKG